MKNINLNENGISNGMNFDSARTAIQNRNDLQITFGTRTNQWHVIDNRETINFNITGLNAAQVQNIDEQIAFALNMGTTVLS